MNDRIKLLAEQANIDLDNAIPIGFAEKFAELIVKECSRIAFDEAAQAGRMNKRGECLFGTIIGRRIEKDFGVEE